MRQVQLEEEVKVQANIDSFNLKISSDDNKDMEKINISYT